MSTRLSRMRRFGHLLIPSLSLVGFAAARATAHQAPPVWQADIQIRTLEVTRSKTSLSARVVVFSENNDDARDARLLIFLPVGSGLERMPAVCTASASPSMVPALRAMVQCDLGAIPVRSLREVTVVTTIPPDGFAKRFGVFTYSGTPDPMPANNYAERVVP